MAVLGDSCSLRLDGFTTWVEVSGSAHHQEAIRAEAWFAPRAFAHGDGEGFTALIDATDADDGFALGHLADGTIAARVDGVLHVGRAHLQPDRWNHLHVWIGPTRVVLGLGADTITRHVPHSAGVRVPAVVVVGRSRDHGGPLPRAIAVGLLAHASVRSDTSDAWPGPSTVDVGIVHGAAVDTTPPRARYLDDPHRPIAHVIAPQGWMNEPHGAIQREGVHHVFYQHNAAGPYWDHISWGHLTSEDLVHWRDQPIAVHPGSSRLAADGIWSGSSVADGEGTHLLVVTAGALGRTPDQSVAIARPDGARWRVDASPILEMPTAIEGAALVPGQFRDPFAWREGSTWFVLVGAGIEGRGGTALLYRSADGRAWESLGPLLTGDVGAHPSTGVMWELPVLLPIGTAADGTLRHALFVAPWWAEESEHHLQHVWHWIGRWDPLTGRFQPDHAEPREFDGGGHLTGPSGAVLEDGRSILWTIAQDKRTGADQIDSGWAHNAGFPLELGLSASGTLTVRPVAELDLLRSERVIARDARLRGRHLDVELIIDGEFELDVFASDDGRERTTLGVDRDRIWVDRSHASREPGYCERRRAIARPTSSAPARARLLLDGSMIEFWVDDSVMITSRSYSAPSSDRVRLRPAPDARISRFDAFRIHSAYRT
ncbi:glycoside hydrolase family 32 protein [Microbacterium sp. E-13]|uniref:glycoside hydrolase family 32 protein n=1 Tax=Microbacterium sp. E-13 TaxID=3404048 RepID=UPI003CE95904